MNKFALSSRSYWLSNPEYGLSTPEPPDIEDPPLLIYWFLVYFGYPEYSSYSEPSSLARLMSSNAFSSAPISISGFNIAFLTAWSIYYYLDLCLQLDEFEDRFSELPFPWLVLELCSWLCSEIDFFSELLPKLFCLLFASINATLFPACTYFGW